MTPELSVSQQADATILVATKMAAVAFNSRRNKKSNEHTYK